MKYNTEKKKEILNIFAESPDRAYTAEEISAVLCPDGAGKSSVYRIISDFERSGEIRRIPNTESRQGLFQYMRGGGCSEHLHLKCLDCGRLIHLDHLTTCELESKVLSSLGFEIDDGSMLFGKCSVCKAKN